MNRQPLDRSFNVAVQHMAARLFPTGFDVGPDAPQTYDELRALLDQPHARMRVWNGASDHTIFADPETNYCFRAWHDWTHWRYPDCDFTRYGEERAAVYMMCDLARVYGVHHPNMRRWCCMIWCEIVEQAEANAAAGGVPDQYTWTLERHPEFLA